MMSEVAPSVAAVTAEAAMHAQPISTRPFGQETKRLIRRLRRKNAVPRRLVALTFAAGLAVFAWFHPKTRAPTRSAWEQVIGQVHKVVGRFRS